MNYEYAHLDCALVVIHNHFHRGNAERIHAIYGKRFSELVQLEPFAASPQSVTVYARSFEFSSYIAQALDVIEAVSASHILFIADDLLLSPDLNERSVLPAFGISSPDQGYISDWIRFDKLSFAWMRAEEALTWSPNDPGVRTDWALPSSDYAAAALQHHGCYSDSVNIRGLVRRPSPRSRGLRGMIHATASAAFHNARNIRLILSSRRLPYPLVGGFSDVFIVPKGDLRLFGHLCGLFGTTRLFAEIAVPTALALSCKSVQTETVSEVQGFPMWTAAELHDLENRYSQQLSGLLDSMPHSSWIHPVKISRWDLPSNSG